jgi:hypothetical protein
MPFYHSYFDTVKDRRKSTARASNGASVKSNINKKSSSSATLILTRFTMTAYSRKLPGTNRKYDERSDGGYRRAKDAHTQKEIFSNHQLVLRMLRRWLSAASGLATNERRRNTNCGQRV